MQFEPCGNRVLVTPDKANGKTAGGLLVPGNTNAYETGLVIGVGDGKLLISGERVAPKFTAGQKIAYVPAGSIEITGMDAKMVLLDNDAILGIITH